MYPAHESQDQYETKGQLIGAGPLSGGSGTVSPPGCGRMSARLLIETEIARLNQRAVMLRQLLDALPTRLSDPADAALWQLVIDARQAR